MVEGDYKRIVPNPKTVKKENKKGRGLGPELYQIVRDPFEESNLEAKEPDIGKRMDVVLNRWWNP